MKRTSLLLLLLLLTRPALAAPEWLERALQGFPERLPAGVACTVEVRRDGMVAVERHDPTRPAGQRWSLLSREGREPTSEDRVEYLRTRAATDEPAYVAAFRLDQLDLTRATIVHDDTNHATVQVPFREEAIENDRLLGRLELTFLVKKEPARIVRYRLQLPAAFSPVIGVKMHDVDAGAEYGTDGLPRRSYSRFRGRIFLRSVSEDIEVLYSGFTPPPLTPNRDSPQPPADKPFAPDAAGNHN